MPRHPLIPDDWCKESAYECLNCTVKCTGNCYYCKCPLLPFVDELSKTFKRLEKNDD